MLLERDGELSLMAGLLAEVGSSGGKVVLIRGEAGIGKSALVSEFIQRHRDEAHVHVGFCDDLLTPQPLGPFWDIAHDQPSLAKPLDDGDRPGFLQATLDLLSRSLRPTIVVIEDTHWADEATFDAIKYFGRRIARTNGLLLLTYRDGEVDYDHPLRAVIGDLPPDSVLRIQLGGLSSVAVASILDDTDLDLDEVVRLTDGNPLFVTEVAATGVDAVPASVRDAVLARAAKLSLEARELLDLVAVIPGEAERSLLEAVLAPTPERLAECERQGLLRAEANSVSFHHELTRQAIESALSHPDRQRLNQQVMAELIGSADASRIVHHAQQAGDVEAIIAFAPQAARSAMAIASHREAVAHFRTLEPYLEQIGEADRATILDDWARSEFYLGGGSADDILDKAIDLYRSTGDNHALARTLTFAVRVHEVSGRPQAAEECSVEALAILEAQPPSEDQSFALSQRAWLSLMRSEHASALEFADQALAMAEAGGHERTVIHSLNTKGSVMYLRGDLGGMQTLEEARSRAERVGYRFEETRALINMSSMAAEHRQVELASDLAQRARDTAGRYELPVLETYAQAHYAEALQWKGDWAAAEDAALEALGSHPHVEVIATWVLGTLQARRGRPEAPAMLERSWALAQDSQERQNLVPAAAATAEYMWLAGGGDPGQIDLFKELVAEEARSAQSPWIYGALALWLWKLGELSDTPEGIAEPYRLIIEGEPMAAADLWSKMGLPYERAIALAHGDEAAQLEALEALEALGATAVAAKLRRAIRDQGLSVPRGKGRTTRDHAAGLTARQAEVLELLDQGLSNTQIADRLFVSPRTIENHVSAVLSKLDSPTREEAVSAARAEGLLTAKG